MTAGGAREPATLPVIDVEEWRACTARAAVVRRVASPTVVLGGRQRPGAELARRAAAAGIVLVGRRSGGSAVALEPTGTLWIDLWLPAGDPLWQTDISRAALWVGAWWERALRLGGLGPVVSAADPEPGPEPGLEVHVGPMEERTTGGAICFGSAAPGELFSHRRKMMGIAQWRCRSGALFQCVAYRTWEPATLADLLAPGDRAFLEAARGAGAGIDSIVAAGIPLHALVASLRRHGPPGPPFRWAHRPMTVRAPGGGAPYPLSAR